MAGQSREKYLQDIILKIIVYSSEKRGNKEKLLQYLTLLKNQRWEKNGNGKTGSGSTSSYQLETTFRKKGATQAIILYFNRMGQMGDNLNEHQQTNHHSSILNNTEREIFSKGLSILGNAFAVDPEAVKEADKHQFAHTLKTFLESKKYSAHADILSRVLKCLANLSVYHKLRSKILQQGIAISVIMRLDEIYKKLTNNSEVVKPALIEEIIIEKDEEIIVSQASRAIRIFCSDYSFQQHLIRFGALLSVGRFLKFSYNQNLFSDILKAMTVLTCCVKRLSRDTLEVLTDIESPDKAILQKIVHLVKTRHSVSKLVEPAIFCLTQLSENVTLAKALITFDVFEAVLESMKHSEEPSRLERLLRLCIALTKDSAAAIDGYLSHRLRLSCCVEIGETIKILKIAELKSFHYWLLSLYEKLSEDKLKDLVSRGIIGVLDKYLRDEIGEYTMEKLRHKIASLDNDTCHVHTKTDLICPFLPKYRCSSPTYMEFEAEEERRRGSGSGSLNSFLESSDSEANLPLSPPGGMSPPGYAGSPMYSPASSPSTSPPYTCNFSPVVSDDEGGGVVYISPSTSSSVSGNLNSKCGTTNEFSEDEMEDMEECEIEGHHHHHVLSVKGECDENHQSTPMDCSSVTEGPALKKLKLDLELVAKDESSTKQKQISSDSSNIVSSTTSDNSQSRLSKEVRLRSNKIHAILGILSRCSHLTVLPTELTSFLPFLLEMLWNGRLSIERISEGTSSETPEDQILIGRMCFQRAFKIVSRICSDISVFPLLIKSDMIPIIYRILLYDLKSVTKKDRIQDFLTDYSTTIMDSLIGMSGLKNETSGWRQGYFLSMCCTGSPLDEYTQAVLSIPLLYRQQCPIFRNFEERTKNWQAIFDLLTNIDAISVSQFQNCILSLTCIAKTKGLKWMDADNASKRNLLYSHAPLPKDLTYLDTVCFELDDGFKLHIPKKFLTQASPVFAAMFDGHFREAGQQKVNLRKTSLSALNALVIQIYQQSQHQSGEGEDVNRVQDTVFSSAASSSSSEEHSLPSTSLRSNPICDYPLSTLFELLSLCDEFLLDNLYERTLNTLICFYFCPHSAPKIYEESLKFGGLHKTDNHLAYNGNLTRLAIKYLLVGDDICFTLRCGAFWKIFDTIIPADVVQMLKEILSCNSLVF